MMLHAMHLLAILLGLAGGLMVGSAFVALLSVLDIVPRLAQLTASYHRIYWLELAVVCGVLFWTVADFWHWRLGLPHLVVAFGGLLCGTFIGMMAAGLTEVLNVLPIIARRLRVRAYMIWILLAMVSGKVLGSLFDWLVYQRGP